MYDRNNWAQVWLSMPGTAPQQSTLFWFEILSATGVFPFGNVLAADAAHFFANTVGWTNENYNGSFYLHAYLSCTDIGPLVRVHGYAPFPTTPPSVVWAPPLSWVWVVPFRSGKPTWRNAGFTLPITKAAATSGNPLENFQTYLDGWNATWQAGWSSQGRAFRPVSVSYLHRDWKAYDRLIAHGWPCGRIKRQRQRRPRTVGNEPKLLP